MNADGMPIFGKKVKYSIWPIFITFLNLPPKVRFKLGNIFLCAVYPGPSCPDNMNTFFKPFVLELRKLYRGSSKIFLKPTETNRNQQKLTETNRNQQKSTETNKKTHYNTKLYMFACNHIQMQRAP